MLRIKAIAAVFEVILLVSCRQAMKDDPNPPGLELIHNDLSIEGELGSSTWGGIAVDRWLTIPQETISITRGEVVLFEGEGGTPDEAFISVYRQEDVSRPDLHPILEDEIPVQELAWKADLPPGRYVLTIFRQWKNQGDTIHYFSLTILT